MQFKPVSVPRPHRFQDVTDTANPWFVIHNVSIARPLVPTPHIVEALGSAATLAQSGNERMVMKIQFCAAGFWDSNPFELRCAKRIAQFIGPAKQTPTRLRFAQTWSKRQVTKPLPRKILQPCYEIFLPLRSIHVVLSIFIYIF